MKYTFIVDSYGTDALGCACVTASNTAIIAKSDRGAKQIARNRRDVSKILREDGSVIMDGDQPFSTSNYQIGA